MKVDGRWSSGQRSPGSCHSTRPTIKRLPGVLLYVSTYLGDVVGYHRSVNSRYSCSEVTRVVCLVYRVMHTSMQSAVPCLIQLHTIHYNAVLRARARARALAVCSGIKGKLFCTLRSDSKILISLAILRSSVLYQNR